MKRIFITLTLFLFYGLLHAQQPTIDLTLHARVDTTKKDIKEIVSLWKGYLSSQPDSIYNNPYWNNTEKSMYEDFDLTRIFIYQLPSRQLLDYYKPTILSIEKEDDNYAIRTLFSADGLDGTYRQYNPWCITKLFAVEEDGQWKLKNALPILTEHWNRETIGKITFIYPPEHKFNDSLAQQANIFCNSIASKFQLPDWKPFDFYITKNEDELGKLLGFDFFYTGSTTGMCLTDRRILLSGIDCEFYPHELVHLIVPNKERHFMINEGFATWLGGNNGLTFEVGAKIFAEQLAKTDTIKLASILNKEWGWQFSSYYYAGAIICKLVYDKKGVKGIKELLNTPKDDAKLVDELCKLFEINKNELDKYLTNEILKNASSTNAQHQE
jgi:hypothetical protein